MNQIGEHLTPEFELNKDDRVLVIGAGGFTAEHLYLRNLIEMGVPEEQIVLVDNNEERLTKTHNTLKSAPAYLDTDHALQELAEQGHNVPVIFIASSTAAHGDNIQSILNAASAGLLDLQKTKIWCEKPVTAPEIFDEIHELASQHPDLDINVGYILRFSETLAALHSYIDQNNLTITGVEWLYGKDRTKDTRPTQGVFPDEIVHPLSVTDLVLTRAFGDVMGVEVESARIQRRPFADPAVQEKARLANPLIPENPTSDVDTTLSYSFNKDGKVTQIPVTISSSFLLKGESRRVQLTVDGPQGADVLTVDFDIRKTDDDGKNRRADTLVRADGTLIYEWSGDKSAAQIVKFLGSSASKTDRADALTSLEGESKIQQLLTKIGHIAVYEPGSE